MFPYQIYYNNTLVKDEFKNLCNLWAGDFSVAVINGDIVKYILNCLNEKNMFFIILQSDGDIQSDIIRNIFNNNGYDFDKIKSKIIVGTLGQKSEDTKLNYLYMPLDDRLFNQCIVLNHLPSWEQRIPVAYWRGGASGGGLESARCRSVKKLLECKYADVKLTRHDGWENGKNIPDSFFAERVHFTNFLNYKIFLIIDGNCIASNHMWGFATGCVPFIVSNAKCWFQKFLIPDVNFISINYDLSNLIEKIEWVIENDSEAKKIAENALQFSRHYFHPDFQRKYIKEEINKLAEK